MIGATKANFDSNGIKRTIKEGSKKKIQNRNINQKINEKSKKKIEFEQ